jgi:(2Fe-2S) ferredoxin
MKTTLRPWPEGWSGRPTLTVCVNVREEDFAPSCGKRGSLALPAAIERELEARGADVDIQTIRCLGRCANGPNVRVAPSNSWFQQVATADVPELVDTLIKSLSRSVPE